MHVRVALGPRPGRQNGGGEGNGTRAHVLQHGLHYRQRLHSRGCRRQRHNLGPLVRTHSLHAGTHAPVPQALHREPTNVNMNYYDFDSRGLNSLQILSWLQSACRLCDPSPSSKCVRCDRIRACCSAWCCVLVIQLLSNCIMKIVTLCACTSRRCSTWLRSTSESHVPSAVKASDALRAGMTSTFCPQR